MVENMLVSNRFFALNIMMVEFLLLRMVIVTLFLYQFSYDFGIRLFLYQFVGLLFIVFFVVRSFVTRKKYKLNSGSIRVIWLILIIFFFKSTSILGVLFNSQGQQDYFDYFTKGYLYLLFHTILILVSILSVSQLNFRNLNKLIAFIIWLVVALCLYQYVSLICLIYFDFNLDEMIYSDIFSLNQTSLGLEKNIIGDDVSTFFRSGSLIGSVNGFAALLILVLPFTFAMYLDFRKPLYLMASALITISILLTLSRAGLLGLAVTVIAAFFIFRSNVTTVKLLSYGFFGLIFIILVSTSSLLNSAYFRLDTSVFDGPRWDLLIYGVSVISESPLLGRGLNTASIVMDGSRISDVTGNDFHSFYIENFVNLGIFGLIAGIALIIFILATSYGHPPVMKATFIGTLSLILMNFFTNSFDQPYVFIVWLVLYVTAASSSRLKNDSRRSYLMQNQKFNIK